MKRNDKFQFYVSFFFFFLILIFLSLYAKWNFTNKFNFLRYLFSISNLWSSNFDHLYIARYRLGIILEFIIRGYLSWILMMAMLEGRSLENIQLRLTTSINRTSNSLTRLSIKYSRCASFDSSALLNLSNSCR